jgi:hypothetical protein
VAAVAALHQALYRPGTLALVVSPTQRQSSELFRVALNFYRQLGRPVDPESENALSLVLENRSRIVSIPGSEAGIRGYAADLVIVDEAARVPDEVFASLSPMVAVTGGRLVAMSTPAGKRGWFYDAAQTNRWECVVVPATSCPRISAAFLAEEEATLGPAAFGQEYLCQFTDAAGAAFDGDDIAAIFQPGPGRSVPVVAPLPTETELTRRDQQRVARALSARIGAGAARQKRRQTLCVHRWRTLSNGPTYCVWCQVTKTKEESCSA